MKAIAILAVLFLSFTALAKDSFEVIKDGKTYLCRVKANDPGAVLRCTEKAYRGPFSRSESQQLCRNAINEAPADCAIQTYRGPFSRDESLQLCTGVTTTGPSECALKAYRGPFSKSDSMRLCKGDSSLANADCAIEAYYGPYSKEEAIQMCKAGSLHPSKMISKPKKAVL